MALTLPVWFYLVQWIAVSCVMILLNKEILSGWGFSFPCFLTAWHMLFSTILTQVLSRTTKMLPGVGTINSSMITNKLIPMAFFFALSIMMGNKTYLYLSVSFIQMLKAFIPVIVLMLSFSVGLESPSKLQLSIVFMISVGVIISTLGELMFSWIGFFLQIAALFCESIRLVMTDAFLKQIKLDPLSMLYYISPISFLFIFLGFILFESSSFSFTKLFSDSFLMCMLLISSMAAFGLNIAVVLLITNGSAVLMTLGGIIKDILLVILSMVVFHSPITFTQIMGYTVSLISMNAYKNFKSNPEIFTQNFMSYLNKLLKICGLSSLINSNIDNSLQATSNNSNNDNDNKNDNSSNTVKKHDDIDEVVISTNNNENNDNDESNIHIDHSDTEPLLSNV